LDGGAASRREEQRDLRICLTVTTTCEWFQQSMIIGCKNKPNLEISGAADPLSAFNWPIELGA
jgi:hypothetical protein